MVTGNGEKLWMNGQTDYNIMKIQESLGGFGNLQPTHQKLQWKDCGRDVYKVKKIGKTSFMEDVQSSWVEVERFREVFLYKICLDVLF